MRIAIFLILLLQLLSCRETQTKNYKEKSKTEELVKMKRVEYKIQIIAPVENVYSSMIDQDHFKEWVAVFGAKSYYEGSWRKGEKISYLAPDENGQLHGMISLIKENIPNQEIYIQPIGIIENGIEILEGAKVQGLDQSFDHYFFKQNGDTTELKVIAAIYPELEEYFNETWPKALARIKAICEMN